MIFGLKNVYAAIYSCGIPVNHTTEGETLVGAKTVIRNLGCEDYDDEKWFELDTKISFDDNKKKITIGEATINLGKEDYDRLKKQVGNEEARLKFEVEYDTPEGSPAGETYVYVTLKEICTGSDIQGLPKRSEDKYITNDDATMTLRNTGKDIKETIDLVVDFLDDPLGTIANIVINTVRTFADMLQKFANMLVIFEDGTKGGITYTFEEIENDDELDKYAKVRDDDKSKAKYKTSINPTDIKNAKKDKDKVVFSEDTEIPIIPVELYSIAMGDIDILDVNFLTGNHKDKDSVWMKIKNPVVALIHVIIYASSAILITTLIWHGVRIAWGTISPEQRREHIEGLRKFATSLLMLVGSILIMTLGTAFSQMLLSEVRGGAYQEEFPIRVTVIENSQQFSSNITGYVRYMAGTENKKMWEKKAVYTIVY